MSGHSKFGNLTKHAGASARGAGMRCIKCGVVIFYGDRCETHKQELRRRQRRRLKR
jgi:hypothetical protein